MLERAHEWGLRVTDLTLVNAASSRSRSSR
jgi:hypothetical protein